jgi:hypothetical protein
MKAASGAEIQQQSLNKTKTSSSATMIFNRICVKYNAHNISRWIKQKRVTCNQFVIFQFTTSEIRLPSWPPS